MHGSKKFIRARGRPVWDEHAPAARLARYDHNRDEARWGRTRWKRSRHRTRADVYTVTEDAMPSIWGAPDYGRGLTAPASFRRAYEGRFRARVRHLLHHGRYDDLPRRPRDASWDYY